MSKKYRIPVTIIASASHTIGEVECDSLEEFEELAEELWKSQGYDAPNINATNNFDLGDWDIAEVPESHMPYCENK